MVLQRRVIDLFYEVPSEHPAMSSTWSARVLLPITLFGIAVFGISGAVHAEGACPPGSYPIGGQGVQGCAPIPAGGKAEGSGPRATGRWLKTWGAIALSSEGASGAATGRLTKAAASRDAEAVCVSSGGASCKVAFTYKNQCAAASVPTTGDGGTSFGRGATVEIAEKISLDLCAKGGGVGCRKIYSACAEPQFESF